MAEEEVTETETTTDPDDAALIAEVEELTRPEADKDRDKVKHALIAAKRELRQSNRRVKELEPIAASATEIGQRLEKVQPIINAVLNNPKMRAAALQAADGTRSSADTTEQPDDADAIAVAEEMGFYLGDGVTPDAARGARVLARLDARHGKQTDERLRPLASVTLGGKAESNIRAALAATDSEGTPWATRESIEEVVKQLPRELLADPQVADLILNNAIGIDRRKGRTPKPVDEPVFLERQGGGTRTREVPLTAFEQRHLQVSGISEKEYRAAAAKASTGRSIELGK